MLTYYCIFKLNCYVEFSRNSSIGDPHISGYKVILIHFGREGCIDIGMGILASRCDLVGSILVIRTQRWEGEVRNNTLESSGILLMVAWNSLKVI